MSEERTSYSERSPWPGFVTAVLWGSVILSGYPILAGWGNDLHLLIRLSIVAGIAGLAVGLTLVVGGLTVRVQETRLLIHLGSVPLVRKMVPYEEIVGLESVVYQPLREFGGWGVRGFGKRRAWTARGNEAVRLDLAGERVLLVGSDHPHRLEERIRTVAGDRLGGPPRQNRPEGAV